MAAESQRGPLIAIFARAPELGKVKTRLATSVGELAALETHRSLFARTIEVVAATGIAAEVWLDGDPNTLPLRQFPVRTQCDGDLGARMLHTITDVTRRGHRAIVIGSDCPVIDERYLHDASQSLETVDVVLGPVEDGGYVLIGMSRPHVGLFSDMAWSTPTVCAETRRRAKIAGLTTAVLRELWDVDDLAGWRRWQAIKSTPPSSRAGQ